MIFRQAAWDEKLLCEISKKGRRAFSLPSVPKKLSSEELEAKDALPSTMRRRSLPDLPEVSEPQVVRHYLRLSQMNYAVDLGMYPLGSCTMKYNPKVSQRIARDPRLTNLHPYQEESTMQGMLQILSELESSLCEITGMTRFSLTPAAGAQGEFVGDLIIRKYLLDQGQKERDEMLVPDSAHGTNPASAAMAGFNVVKIPSSKEGIVTAEAVKGVLTKKTAGMMLTVPNTLGIFEKEIEEVAKMVHENGGLLYYDGANMNAMLGRVRPLDLGFDVVHLNVHKTFATPHGGGGPGAGPVGVCKKLVEYLPVPLVEKTDSGDFTLVYDRPKSIGRVKSFAGNSAVLIRAYCYILSLGSEGLRQVSDQAVLASNYLLSLIDPKSYSTPFSAGVPRKHELVISASPLKERTGVTAGDVAKAILDYGIHSPTTYFPLIVPEALMIEPTETESLEDLERYATTLNQIAAASEKGKENVQLAPRNTSIGRLDEYKASHPATMMLNWRKLRAESKGT